MPFGIIHLAHNRGEQQSLCRVRQPVNSSPELQDIFAQQITAVGITSTQPYASVEPLRSRFTRLPLEPIKKT
jgi:hypothetical protein